MASSASGGTASALTRVVVGVVVLAVAVVIFSTFVGALVDAERQTFREDKRLSGGATTLSGTNVSLLEVHQSLNDSARLDGSGSLSGSLGSDVADNRTVSTWARIRDQSGRQQVVSIDSRTQIVYNATSAEWACWSYADTTGDTHRVAVNTSSPGTLTNLQCERANGQLELRRNDTAAVSSVTLDSANATSRTLSTKPLNGSVDETRVFNGSLTPAQHGTLVAVPTGPLDVNNRVARVYYDSYGGYGSVPVYISGGSLDTSAASKAPGLQGQGAVEGADFGVSDDTITTLDGGTLEGAPVLFAEFRAAPIVAVGQITPGIGTMLRVAAVLPLIIIAAVIRRRLDI